KAADMLRAKGVGTVILTLGARGAFVAGDNIRRLVPGFKVKAVDTTAAGDIFAGAFAIALVEGQDYLSAVRLATVAAGISVTREGAQPSIPNRTEVEELRKRLWP
ncbi:MAG: PfkB family carbohydrate kinase, partial [Candidatus Omnitrophica bacterium]|nr:PfkB family carbohydrate kinase [Candidatus Omnitrophota bacterium]